MSPKAKHPQRPNGLPALSISLPNHSEAFNRVNSESTVFYERTPTSKSSATASIIEASHTILFSAQTLKRAVSRCLSQTGNDSLQLAFTPHLNKTRSTTEKLELVLDSKRPTPQLIQLTVQCISNLKDLCNTLSTRLSILVQGLDPKSLRHLLVSLYSATVDTKEAWEIISPYLTIDPLSTLPNKSKVVNKYVSNSELTPQSPLASPLTNDNSQLYTYLKNAVTGSFNVLSPLRLSIEESLNMPDGIASLQDKLKELLRQAQHVTDLSHRLDKSIDAHMSNKEECVVSPSRLELSRDFWQDTNIYLKAMVSLMTLIRSISKEENYVWPRTVKQGCLYVTRMTAEVAKLWNKYSTFAQDGFFLGEKREK